MLVAKASDEALKRGIDGFVYLLLGISIAEMLDARSSATEEGNAGGTLFRQSDLFKCRRIKLEMVLIYVGPVQSSNLIPRSRSWTANPRWPWTTLLPTWASSSVQCSDPYKGHFGK